MSSSWACDHGGLPFLDLVITIFKCTRVRRPSLGLIELPLFVVRGGKLVRRTGPRSYEPLFGASDPHKLIKAAVPPAELVYIWDADGIEAGAANHEFYQKLERNRIAPWVDAGCRNPEDAMDAFFAGAEVLTVRVEHMDEAKLADFADMAEYEFHLALRFSTKHPDSPLTAWDMRRLVGELHAKGVILEASPTTDRTSFSKFVGLVRNGGIEVSVLSTEKIPWLRDVALETSAERIISPPESKP